MKRLTLCLLTLVLLLSGAEAPAQSANSVPKFNKETVDVFRKIPVQEGGRVKPLDTVARFMLLRFNGVRAFTTPSGDKIDPMEWLMHCIFYPDLTDEYRHFIVDDSEAIAAIGAETHERRDRYSYSEIRPHRAELFTQAQEYSKVDAKERDRVQQQVILLANNVFEYEQITHYLFFAGRKFRAEGETALGAAFPEPEGVGLTEAILRMQGVMQDLRQRSGSMDREELEAEVGALTNLMGQMRSATGLSFGLALLPPSNVQVREWRTVSEVAGATEEFAGYTPEELAPIASLERLPELRDNRAAFLAQAKTLHGSIEKLASARGEYDKVPLEVSFYKGDYFFKAQWLFVLSFLIFALSLLLPYRPWLYWTAYVSVLPPLALLVIGITLRCIIRSRPPISTLYETILFIAATCVIVALFLEWVNRQRIALSTASVLGFVGMVLAYRYEAKEGVDTMPTLIAVLDTNFWLMTHVTIINIGYAASFLAAALSHLYIFGRLFKIRNATKTYRGLTRMVYGVICFGLVFSVVGTVLGGIWANDSWGRFWGWDPKENGALMICIWGLVILHARMGGHIRDMGINMGAVILAMITAFSWWGVNLLGVGLHSYGFTSGIMNLLVAYWVAECVVLLIAAFVWFRDDFTHDAGEKVQSPQLY